MSKKQYDCYATLALPPRLGEKDASENFFGLPRGVLRAYGVFPGTSWFVKVSETEVYPAISRRIARILWKEIKVARGIQK